MKNQYFTMDNQDSVYAQLPVLDPNSVKALRNSIKHVVHCIKCGPNGTITCS